MLIKRGNKQNAFQTKTKKGIAHQVCDVIITKIKNIFKERIQVKKYFKLFNKMGLLALLLVVFMAGCGKNNNDDSTGAGPAPAGGICQGSACVSLGTAADYAILAKTGVSTVPASIVTGNIGLSPAARVFLTGWSQTSDATDTYSTSAQVVAPGKLYAADYVGGTTSVDLTTSVGNIQTAYTDAAGRTPGLGLIDLYTGDISGKTLAPGVYKWSTGVSINTDVTLAGSATDIWIFQIAGGLTQAAAAKVILSNGALPKNIFWQVASGVTLGTTAHIEGIILSQTSIILGTGASVNGRLLAQTAVTLDQSTVTRPAP
jgi:hypothetical protein